MEDILFIRDLAVVLLIAGATGALFRKLGLSVVVGYLVAGMLIGPNTPPFALVSDIGRIHTLSQLGLVFLMFFVGLGLSLRRIGRLGPSLVLTVAITASLVFILSRLLAAGLGWTPTAGLFLAAMLMVSSSAIMTKTLAETGLTHEKFAQRAMGMTILEDIVAIVMLTLLGARVGAHSAHGLHGTVGWVLAMLGGFVALIVVVGLLIVPGFLRTVARAEDNDLKVSAIAGVLLGVACLAKWAGYSVALGSFLLGMIVAETPFRDRIERGFVGVQGMFAVVFFVSIGMLIDVRLLLAHWGVILLVSLFAIAARVLGATGAQLVSGSALGSALRTAVTVTPIGEFSYIIAQIGHDAGAVPDFFYSLAVGVSVVTAFTAPLLLRFSDPLAAWAEARQPGRFRGALAAYREWLDTLSAGLRASGLWRLTRGRIAQVALEILLLVGVLGFSPKLFRALQGIQSDVGVTVPAWSFPYWSAVFCVAMVLAVAAWRNVAALAMLFGEAVFVSAAAPFKGAFENAVQILVAAGFFAVFWVTFPFQLSGWVRFGVVAATMALFLVLFWRQLVRWHSRFQFSVKDAFALPPGRHGIHSGRSVDEADWGVDLVEVTVPEGASYVGRSLVDLGFRSRFGCTIVEIERQGFEIPNPRPDAALYAGDKVLILGGESQVAQARAFLEPREVDGGESPSFDENILETAIVPEGGARAGRSLAELRIFSETGVQVLGLRRASATLLNPGAEEILRPGDQLLILATPVEHRNFERWLAE